MRPYVTSERAAQRAEDRIAQFEAAFGAIEHPPVPLERIVDEIFDLKILWTSMGSNSGLNPYAGLQPAHRRIVLNEDRRDWFDRNPGTLNFTLAHELGHWDLHVDHAAMNHPVIPGLDQDSRTMQLRTPQGIVEVLYNRLRQANVSSIDALEVVRTVGKEVDTFFEGRQVSRYAAALLMPRRLFTKHLSGRDLSTLSTLSELASDFAVSRTAFKIRLEELGLAFIAPDGSVHRSKAEFLGQTSIL